MKDIFLISFILDTFLSWSGISWSHGRCSDNASASGFSLKSSLNSEYSFGMGSWSLSLSIFSHSCLIQTLWILVPLHLQFVISTWFVLQSIFGLCRINHGFPNMMLWSVLITSNVIISWCRPILIEALLTSFRTSPASCEISVPSATRNLYG